MTLEARKIALAKKILDTNDKDIITYIQTVFDTEKNWLERYPDEIKEDILESKREIAQNKGVPDKEVRKNGKEMVKEIIWMPRAIKAYNRVVDYLLAEWSEKEAKKFISLSERIVNLVAKNPRAFRELEKNHHEALITKHNLLVYEIKGNTVFILTIWDTRRNPRRKKI